MEYLDLKQADLEQILSKEKLSEEDIKSIRNDAEFYDKYFLVKYKCNLGFIKIWRQHFSDPYMDLELEECDLANFKGQKIPTEKYIDVLDQIFELPQLIRCLDKDLKIFKKKGFEEIADKPDKTYRSPEKSSTIISMFKNLNNQEIFENIEKVRLMKLDDLPIVEDIFSKDYSARFRAVRLLYNYGPDSSFVYDDGSIKGVLFGEIYEDYIYVHQIFVKKEFRGHDVDKALLNRVCEHAKKLGKSQIKGTIRGNLFSYYVRLGLESDFSTPKSYYLIRFALNQDLR